MPKPIFLIKIDVQASERVSALYKKLQEQIEDWHILIAACLHNEPPEFSAFTINNADDIEIEKLKELVLKEIDG